MVKSEEDERKKNALHGVPPPYRCVTTGVGMVGCLKIHYWHSGVEASEKKEPELTNFAAKRCRRWA